jgi:hypothetical protein
MSAPARGVNPPATLDNVVTLAADRFRARGAQPSTVHPPAPGTVTAFSVPREAGWYWILFREIDAHTFEIAMAPAPKHTKHDDLCFRRYAAEGWKHLQVPTWVKHARFQSDSTDPLPIIGRVLGDEFLSSLQRLLRQNRLRQVELAY